jgi:hypothetical protein
MDARSMAQQLAYGRLALGAGLVLAPRLFAGGWTGRDSAGGGGRVLAAGLGARDVAIGAGTAHALRSGGSLREWLLAGAISDAVDCVSTLRARGSIPTAGVVGVGALAGAGTLISLWAARELGQPTP